MESLLRNFFILCFLIKKYGQTKEELMKNKIFTFLLALSVMLSLSACNNTHDVSSESSTTISSSKTLDTSSEDKVKEEVEKEQKQEELKSKEEEKKQAEINQKTSEATNAIVQAEANPTRDTYTAASTAIQAIPGGNQDLSNRLANIDSTIKANEAAQAEAARVAEQQAQEQAAAQAQQQNNQETVLITPTGKKYHNHACGNGNYSPVTLQEALNRGLTACEKCFN